MPHDVGKQYLALSRCSKRSLGFRALWHYADGHGLRLSPPVAVIFAPDLLTAKKERRVLIETARFLRVSVRIKT